MQPGVRALIAFAVSLVRSRLSLQWEIVALRHQLTLSHDFFTVPTVRFTVRFVRVVLAHARRRLVHFNVHFNVTAHPTAQWTAQQLVEAFTWDTAPPHTGSGIVMPCMASAFSGASRTWASSKCLPPRGVPLSMRMRSA